MTPKHYKLELYNINYYFFIGWDPRAFKEYLDLQFDLEVDVTDYDHGMTVFDEDLRAVFVWVRQSHDMASTLCHEAVHAACYTLNWANVYVDMKEDEALAYLAELIFMKGADKVIAPQ
jgi:hypothetical protein